MKLSVTSQRTYFENPNACSKRTLKTRVTTSFSSDQVGRTSTTGPDAAEGAVRQVDVPPTKRNAEPSRMDDRN